MQGAPVNPLQNDHSIFQCKRGWGPQKKLSLERIICSLKPDIILIQETMCLSEKARETLQSWLKNWSFCATNAEGMSKGLITGWSPDFRASFSSYRSSISVKLRHKDNNFFFSIINIYEPYANRVPFWEDLKDASAFRDPLTVVGGDLNFTLSSREVWGESSREDRQKRVLSFLPREP